MTIINQKGGRTLTRSEKKKKTKIYFVHAVKLSDGQKEKISSSKK